MKMKNKLRRNIVLLLGCLMTMCNQIDVLAAENNENTASLSSGNTEFEISVNEFRTEYCEADLYLSEYSVVDEWGKLIENEGIKFSLDKQIIVIESEITTELAETIRYWNMAIECGLLAVDTEEIRFYTPDITEKTIEQAMSVASESQISQNPDASVNAWLSTVSFWVSRVREGGEWDYKKDYGILCCIYHGQPYIHKTGEWAGNYNYGYTGKLLFPLDVLHMGSKAVSSAPELDEATDWPAIDEGYADAP